MCTMLPNSIIGTIGNAVSATRSSGVNTWMSSSRNPNRTFPKRSTRFGLARNSPRSSGATHGASVTVRSILDGSTSCGQTPKYPSSGCVPKSSMTKRACISARRTCSDSRFCGRRAASTLMRTWYGSTMIHARNIAFVCVFLYVFITNNVVL